VRFRAVHLITAARINETCSSVDAGISRPHRRFQFARKPGRPRHCWFVAIPAISDRLLLGHLVEPKQQSALVNARSARRLSLRESSHGWLPLWFRGRFRV
jgi:hypothetical protein